jgi:class 3 adenylate cyclase
VTLGQETQNRCRRPGSRNKLTTEVRAAILDAFVQLGGSSYLVRVANENPAALCALLGKILPMELAAAGEIIHHFEGTLERFLGDGLMVLFNDPIPCENSAAQAVRMALAMRDRVAELAKGWRKQGHELGFGVGVAQGYATIGRIGFEGRFDYAAIGTVANVASRLCAEAKSGQILITHRVLAAVEELIECEPFGEIVLKGLSRPVSAHDVRRLKD